MRFRRWLLALIALTVASCGGGDGSGGFVCPEVTTAPPDVSGDWTYVANTIQSSNCAASIDDLVLDTIGGTCEVDIVQSGTNLTVTDCRGKQSFGCVDGEGNISYSIGTTRSFDGCTFTGSSLYTGDELGDPPASGRIKTPLTFSGNNCGILQSCTVILNAEWRLVR